MKPVLNDRGDHSPQLLATKPHVPPSYNEITLFTAGTDAQNDTVAFIQLAIVETTAESSLCVGTLITSTQSVTSDRVLLAIKRAFKTASVTHVLNIYSWQ